MEEAVTIVLKELPGAVVAVNPGACLLKEVDWKVLLLTELSKPVKRPTGSFVKEAFVGDLISLGRMDDLGSLGLVVPFSSEVMFEEVKTVVALFGFKPAVLFFMVEVS